MSNRLQNIVPLKQQSGQASSPCLACMKRSLCPMSSMTESDPALVSSVDSRTFHAGEHVFEAGNDFNGIYVVRAGFFKSSFTDASGEMQVTGFHFPGEVFGMDGIGGGHYGHTVSALDTGSVCRIPLSVFTGSQSRPDTGAQTRMLSLVRLMSDAVARDRDMLFKLGKTDSRRRFADFLCDIANRMGSSGYSNRDFQLCMSRTDIANYLCLAIETVSRLFSQFQAQGLIHDDRRHLQILDAVTLQAMALENQYEDAKPMKKAG